jgi:hypothetical protein
VDEIQNQLSFNASLKIDFQGSRVTSDIGRKRARFEDWPGTENYHLVWSLGARKAVQPD